MHLHCACHACLLVQSMQTTSWGNLRPNWLLRKSSTEGVLRPCGTLRAQGRPRSARMQCEVPTVVSIGLDDRVLVGYRCLHAHGHRLLPIRQVQEAARQLLLVEGVRCQL